MTFRPNEDFIYQEVKLFVEGVQVPYDSITISSSMGALPSATISMPPYPGLMDIVRYYQPKVHIFFVDPHDGEDKVLFIGHIASGSFSRSRQAGGSSVSFQCNHKNALMSDVLIDFNNPVDDTNLADTNKGTNDNANNMNVFNSTQYTVMALRGIVDSIPDKVAIDQTNSKVIQDSIKQNKSITDSSLLSSKWADREYGTRFKGFPGVLMNMWNQFKLNYVNSPDNFESMGMYITLVEEGIQYFDRIGGHYYIEEAMDRGKMDPCTDKGKGKDKILVPGCLRLFVTSAVQTDMAILLMQQAVGFSGELTDFLSTFQRVLEKADYDLITLTSPVEGRLDQSKEWSDDNSQALETIIKPETPFYYSPACNIYYPSMYSSINVMQEEASIPTRITLTSQAIPYTNATLHKKYRAPASVREAIAAAYAKDAAVDKKVTAEQEKAALLAGNLLSTTDGLKNRTKVGIYEWGRGVRHRRYEIPYWLSVYASSVKGNDKGEQKDIQPGTKNTEEDKADAEALDLLKKAWEFRYGAAKSKLNPYDPSSGVWPHERLLFAFADYRFTKEVAGSKAGNLDGVFNPYIIPGYPMDILDKSPVNPCFHALCTGVTHMITPRSISTSVSFVAAITYTELANYHLQFISPWLQVKLGIVSEKKDKEGNVGYTSSILANDTAKQIAEEEYYYPTLGVGSLSPDDIYDFEKGTLRPVSVETEVLKGAQRELNPNLTTQGNLLLVSRPIESRASLEKRFGITFIDMVEGNYNQNIIRYTDAQLAESELFEPGKSQFLKYHRVSNPED